MYGGGTFRNRPMTNPLNLYVSTAHKMHQPERVFQGRPMTLIVIMFFIVRIRRGRAKEQKLTCA